MSCLARAPKSTSVPSAAQLSATGSEKARLAAMNGSRRANSSGLSMNSVPANSGLPANAFGGAVDTDAPRSMDETHVRHRVEEAAHVGEDAVFGRVCPELAGDLELLVDTHRFGDVDRAVRHFWGVVHLAQRGVPGAGVVPGTAAFGGYRVQPFDQGD